MKRFLIISLYFILPILLAAIVVEYLIRQVPNPYKCKYEWMQKNAEDVEVLILGSSHTFTGIRPEFFESKAYNLANHAQQLRQDLFLLEYWSDRYKNLKTVIYPVSYFSWFAHGLEYERDYSFRCRYYKIYMDCDLYPDISLYNLEISDYQSARGKVERYLSNEDVPGCDGYGWGTTFRLSAKSMEIWNSGIDAENAVKRHTRSWEYINQNSSRMKELADFCKGHDIQLVLITTPCWHTYYDNLNQKQLAKMYELTDNFSKKYGFPYLDYLKDDRFDADDFYDCDHLSDVGAAKFTKILVEDIKSIRK